MSKGAGRDGFAARLIEISSFRAAGILVTRSCSRFPWRGSVSDREREYALKPSYMWISCELVLRLESTIGNREPIPTDMLNGVLSPFTPNSAQYR